MDNIREILSLSRMKNACSFILRHYGANHQIEKCIEEMEELKHVINGTDFEAIQEEVADVLITTLQMALIVGFDKVVEQIDYKLNRTIGVIERTVTMPQNWTKPPNCS